jgi:hypothetical protein
MELRIRSVSVTRKRRIAVRWFATLRPARDVELVRDSDGVDCFSVSGTLFPDSCAVLLHEGGDVRVEWEDEEYASWHALRDVLHQGHYDLDQIAQVLLATKRSPAKRLALALLSRGRSRRPAPARFAPAVEARKPQLMAKARKVDARTVVVRRQHAHIVGEHGVFAKRAISEGTELVFDATDYTVSDVTRICLNKNAFDHPHSKRKAIDSKSGSLLQSINSTWNGREHNRSQNVQHYYAGGRMTAMAVADIATGQELLFNYMW